MIPEHHQTAKIQGAGGGPESPIGAIHPDGRTGGLEPGVWEGSCSPKSKSPKRPMQERTTPKRDTPVGCSPWKPQLLGSTHVAARASRTQISPTPPRPPSSSQDAQAGQGAVRPGSHPRLARRHLPGVAARIPGKKAGSPCSCAPAPGFPAGPPGSPAPRHWPAGSGAGARCAHLQSAHGHGPWVPGPRGRPDPSSGSPLGSAFPGSAAEPRRVPDNWPAGLGAAARWSPPAINAPRLPGPNGAHGALVACVRPGTAGRTLTAPAGGVSASPGDG